MEQEPRTLQEAAVYFSDPVRCREYIVKRRWPNGVSCPTCGSAKVTFSEKHNRWQCGSHHAKRQLQLRRARSLRIPRSVSTNGLLRCGSLPTARTASVLGRFTGRWELLKRPRGLCCIESVMQLTAILATSCPESARLTRVLSAVVPETCI